MGTDYDALLKKCGVGVYHDYETFWTGGMSSYDVSKALAIGALDAKRLGPRKGLRLAIVSEEAWGRMKQWRAALALGARRVSNSALMK